MRTFICAVFFAAGLSAQSGGGHDGGEKVDLYTINRIRNEAFQNSKVMENAFYLTDVYGPRLTGSPGIQAAAEWAVRRFNEWGLSNAKLEKWGPFGRTWYCVRFAAHMKEPQYTPLIGFARPWSPGTNGTLTGDPVLAPIHTEADMEKFKGKLKGKIVLLEDARPSPLITSGLARRLTNDELAAEALAPDPSPESPFFAPIPRLPQPLPYPGYNGKEDREAARKWRNKVNRFLREEGVALTLIPGYGTDGGTVFATAAGSRELRDEVPPPAVALTLEHYDRIVRLIEKKTPVTLQFDIENRMENEEKDSFNVTAEIPGAGKGDKKDEIVMLGAHLDSWTGGTGATEHARLSGYFNLDNGTGKIRGVYLQDNDMMRPVFETWLGPFKDLGASTVTIRKTGGTDHLSFDAVGLPGFQFIQDPVEYGTRTHHSNMDLYDRLQQPDLMQAAAIMASMVYHAAMRDQMLPRKELPKPEPKKKHEEEKEKTEKASVAGGH